MGIYRMLIALAAAGTLACSAAVFEEDGSPSPSNGNVALDDSLSIPIGQIRSADGGALEVRFDARVADSRCPANVVCVWQGDAHVRVSTRIGGSGAAFQEAQLHSTLEPRQVTAGSYAMTMIGMTPYPGTGQDSLPATLLVRVTRK